MLVLNNLILVLCFICVIVIVSHLLLGGVAIPMIMGYTSDTVQSYESILIVLLIMALIASVVCFCIFFTKSHVVLSKGMQV